MFNAIPISPVRERLCQMAESPRLSDKHHHFPSNGNIRFRIDDPIPFSIDFDARQMA